MPIPFLVAGSSATDVQRTSFSIDALARYACNTWDEAIASGKFDVVVIGSGMYGSYAASKLYELSNTFPAGMRRPRILVLESGPFLITEHVQNLTRVGSLSVLVAEPLVPTTQSNVTFSPHHRCVGGKSLFWGGWAPRLTDADLTLWPADVRAYLTQVGQQDGYEFVEKEIGASESTDFISGALFDALKTKATQAQGSVPSLTRVADPPIAVLGKAPASGLFSFDKFSSLPLLLDAIREDSAEGSRSDRNRRLFLVPMAEVLKLHTTNGVVTRLSVALHNAVNRADAVRFLDLPETCHVVLAGNTINSTRLALNSFPRPSSMGDELMGRNFMFHVRGNYFWRIKRSALGIPPDQKLQTAAFHVEGKSGPLPAVGRSGRFHLQCYAAANADPATSPGMGQFIARNPEGFLYRLLPSLEDINAMLDAQDPTSVAFGIRTIGETFGDRTSKIGSNPNVSWMSVNPFGGSGDDVYVDDNGVEVRVPQAYVHLVERDVDTAVRDAQRAASFQLVAALAGADTTEAGNRDEDAFANPARRVVYIGNPATQEDGNGTTYHECGTLWMGEQAADSVTDVGGRFHHIHNASCVDQALFPTAGSANPVPTGLSLARLVVRNLLARYQTAGIAPATQNAVELYDGNLAQWTVAGADNFFPLQTDGIVTIGAGTDSKSPQLGVLLLQTKSYTNFTLEIDWRSFSVEANAGIFLRAPPLAAGLNVPPSFYQQAIEVQIDERGFNPAASHYGSPLHKTGAVYERLPARIWAARAVTTRGQTFTAWNRFVITVQNDQIRVELNGRLVSSGQVNMLPQGFIGLQCHTEVVQFRQIRIKELL